MKVQSVTGFGTARASVHVAACTRQARMLLRGRNKAGGLNIAGLQEFASQSWIAARMSGCDDPFADYVLVQVETGYKEAVKRLRDIKSLHLLQWRETFSGSAAVAVPTARFRSIRMRIPCSIHASMAIALILQADGIIHMLQTMVGLGVLGRGDAYREIDPLVSGIRRMMSGTDSWAPTGCTRRDLVERTDKAIAAVERLTKRQFIERSMFGGVDDICDYFGGYAYRPEFALALDAQTFFKGSGEHKA